MKPNPDAEAWMKRMRDAFNAAPVADSSHPSTRGRPLKVVVEIQPIETAPRDGSEILLYRGEGTVIACWGTLLPDSPNAPRYWVYDFNNRDNEFMSIFDNPTHWSPVPNLIWDEPVGDRRRTSTKATRSR